MKKFGVVLLLLFFYSSGFSITTSEIRDIMEKKVANVEDALSLTASLKSERSEKEMDLKKSSRLSSLKKEAKLDAGSLAIIAIEFKKCDGGIIYSLTGWSKYAAESLIHQKIFPRYFSWNREISGNELIEFITALKEKAESPKK
jgi:hypothetical protein